MSELETLELTLLADIDAAGDEGSIEAVRVNALGKKGSISELLKTLGTMTPEERQTRGAQINALKNTVAEAIAGLREGDVLLIAGKGHETGQIVKGTIIPYSDHDAVDAALRGDEHRG